MTMMTTQDRHDLEAIEARELHGTCEHGRAIGYSNYDVAFCGDCEREEADAAAYERYREELFAAIAQGHYLVPIGPTRDDLDVRVLVCGKARPIPSLDDDAPF